MNKNIPENFRSVVNDFTNDLSLTFPEYTYLWNKWCKENDSPENTMELFNYCTSFYPERFFDILYQNDDIFLENSKINTLFLPDVDFKILFNCNGVTVKTKQSIWKYLQLVLFTIIHSVDNKNMFGETMNIFEGINENELQEKIQETMTGISEFFSTMEQPEDCNTNEDTPDDTNDESNNEAHDEPQNKNKEPKIPPEFTGFQNMPDIENMQNHLKTLFDGKIGKLAKEMAEEITNDINGIFNEGDKNDIKSVQDVIKSLLKNPKKMMDLIKNVGDKLNKKMESGDISQEELMKEASEIFGKMKESGNGSDLNEMMKKMMKQMGGMGNMGGMGGKNMRIDTNAMENMFRKQTLKEKMREKLAKKMEEKRKIEELQKQFMNSIQSQPQYVEHDVDKIMKDLNLENEVSVKPQTNQSSKKKKKGNKK